MNYPIVIHKDSDSDYGVTVPDLPGCFSAGRTLDEAVLSAREAIELHIEGLVEEGQAVPRPGSVEKHQRNRRYRGGTWAYVDINQQDLRTKAVRVNITIPERILTVVDRFAAERGQSRSGLLVEAVTQYMRPKSRGKSGQ